MTQPNALLATGLVQEDVSLAPLTTYKFGGPSRYFAEVRSPEEMERVVSALIDLAGEGRCSTCFESLLLFSRAASGVEKAECQLHAGTWHLFHSF